MAIVRSTTAGSYNVLFSSTTNRITTSGYGYDSAGNCTNDGVHTYAFDGNDKIKSVDSTTAYTYDGSGERVRKLVGENIRFVYGLRGELIAEFDGSGGNLKKEYISGGITIEPTAVNSNGTQYPTADQLGTARVITNSSGSVVARHDYMPFGEELGAGTGGRTTGMGFSNSGDNNRKKFTGYERDNETGLDFAQARYNSSMLGRFTSPDPFAGSATTINPQSFNRYAYVGNNPVNAIDTTGLAGESAGAGSLPGAEGALGRLTGENGVFSTESWRAEDTAGAPGSKPPELTDEEMLALLEQMLEGATVDLVIVTNAEAPQEPSPVATQSATVSDVPNCHMCFGQIPTTVVVDQMNNPGARVRNVNGTDSLVVGVDLRVTFLDQNGDPVSGTVTESVPGVIQATGAVPLNTQGRGGDLVSNSLGSVPASASEQRNALQFFNKDFTTNQTATFTVVPDNGMAATMTQQRSLTNMVPGATPIAGGAIRGYTFAMEKPRIRVP